MPGVATLCRAVKKKKMCEPVGSVSKKQLFVLKNGSNKTFGFIQKLYCYMLLSLIDSVSVVFGIYRSVEHRFPKKKQHCPQHSFSIILKQHITCSMAGW